MFEPTAVTCFLPDRQLAVIVADFDDDRPHDRFLLTDRGGLLSTYGWDSGEPGRQTVVSLLDDDTYAELWKM